MNRLHENNEQKRNVIQNYDKNLMWVILMER